LENSWREEEKRRTNVKGKSARQSDSSRDHRKIGRNETGKGLKMSRQ